MHGLVNRALQCFLHDTYGQERWHDLATRLELPEHGFEALLHYDDEITQRLMAEASRLYRKPSEALLEDLGTYLVSHSSSSPVRRLLRFSGTSFVDFLHSLDDLPDRARLAVPDLSLPSLELDDLGAGTFALRFGKSHPGYVHVLTGILRAIADDYGALVLIEPDVTEPDAGGEVSTPTISIQLLDGAFACGRDFSLTGPSAAVPSEWNSA